MDLLTLEQIKTLPHGFHHGYVVCYLPKNHPQRQYSSALWAFEHRLVASALLGRTLTNNDTIHHKDGDKTNNNPDNILITNNSKHGQIHNPLRGEWKQCLACGNIFYTRPALQNRLYCSKKCGQKSPKALATKTKDKNLCGRTPDLQKNQYIYDQKQQGRTWLSLALEFNLCVGSVRDRYKWFSEYKRKETINGL